MSNPCKFCKTPTLGTVSLTDFMIARFERYGAKVLKDQPCCGRCEQFKKTCAFLHYQEGRDYTLNIPVYTEQK